MRRVVSGDQTRAGGVSDQGEFSGLSRPSFASDAAASGRIAVIDVGSNSVRLVVYEGATRSPAYFFNEKALCGLGVDLARTGRLSPEGRRRALSAIRRFVALADAMGVGALQAVATAAVRDAEDGPDFATEVQQVCNLRLRIASGVDEARLAARGVLFGAPRAEGVVADLGGSSLEFATIGGGRVSGGVTTPLGPQPLAAIGDDPEALDAHIDAVLEGALTKAMIGVKTLHAVGGAWRALARAQMNRVAYPLHVLDGYEVAAGEMAEAAAFVAGCSLDDLKAKLDVSSGRLATTPMGARVMARLIARLKPERVRISAFGLREGVLQDLLPGAIRRRDPLIDGCLSLERHRARFPGFGEELARWLDPLVSDWSDADRRLARAAAILNDVNWRIHPDYRASSCFATVTRASIVGLDHGERIFVGAVLLNRYKGGLTATDGEAVAALLDKEALTKARMLGKAIRLGAMISASTPGALSAAPLRRDDQTLELQLTGELRDLAGEIVEKRLKSLASRMNLAPRLTTE